MTAVEALRKCYEDPAGYQREYGTAPPGPAICLLPRSFVKPFRGNTARWSLDNENDLEGGNGNKRNVGVTHLYVKLYPDGGINRLRAFARDGKEWSRDKV